jgi:hypothetical protein
MHGIECHDFQNEQIKCALGQFKPRFSHFSLLPLLLRHKQRTE